MSLPQALWGTAFLEERMRRESSSRAGRLSFSKEALSKSSLCAKSTLRVFSVGSCSLSLVMKASSKGRGR